MIFLLLFLLLPVPSFERVKEGFRGSEKTLLDRQGRVLQQWRYDPEGRRLDWTALPLVSEAMKDAVLRVEDKRFYQHIGINVFSLAALPYHILRGQRLRGSSTIPMQLAGLLNPELRSGRVSLWRKIRQMSMALRLSFYWSKDEILEAYLNLLSYRGEFQGIAAASQALYQKVPHGLFRDESLILASLIANPNASGKKVGQRACLYRREGDDSCEALQKKAHQSLDHRLRLPPRIQDAPHIARFFPDDKEKLASSLDRDLQIETQTLIAEQMANLKSQNVRDASVLVIDHKNGEVLAYVGSSGRFSESPQVDGVRAPRQAGSTLKPFLYAKAFEERLLSPDSLLADEDVKIPTSTGLYTPKNYDHNFRGLVRVREALADSLNVPAVRTVDLLGVDVFYRFLGKLGFASRQPEENYGHSLALGAMDVTLWELAHAYTVLARRGQDIRLRFDRADSAADSSKSYAQILDPKVADQIAEILSSKEYRSGTFGLNNALSTTFWTAVKTGTSKDMRDNWCIGWSERYTVAVWVGNFDGSPMWNVSGVSGAGPVWRNLMDYLHRERPSQRRVVSAAAHAQEPKAETHGLSIVYPLDKMLIAYDPDIPEGRQVLSFESEAPLSEGQHWRLDGKVQTDDFVPIDALKSGYHKLEISDESGASLASVSFEMRGREGLAKK